MSRQGAAGVPITPQGTAKVNGVQNVRSIWRRKTNEQVLYRRAIDMSEFSAEKHESAFVIKDHVDSSTHSSMGAPPLLEVSTSLNGLEKLAGLPTHEETTPDALKRKTRERILFVGINDTTWDAKDAGTRSNHSAITVAGTVTVLNTGPVRVCVGDTVVWDIPDFDDVTPQKGSHLKGNKCLLVLRPLQNIRDLAKDLTLPDLTALVPKEAFIKAAEQLNSNSWEERSRIVGKALTNAQPGEHFDLLLGYTHG